MLNENEMNLNKIFWTEFGKKLQNLKNAQNEISHAIIVW